MIDDRCRKRTTGDGQDRDATGGLPYVVEIVYSGLPSMKRCQGYMVNVLTLCFVAEWSRRGQTIVVMMILNFNFIAQSLEVLYEYLLFLISTVNRLNGCVTSTV
jgi:hypothetical protein